VGWRDIKAVVLYSAVFGTVVLTLAIQSAVKQRAAQEKAVSRETAASPIAMIAATDLRRVMVRDGTADRRPH